MQPEISDEEIDRLYEALDREAEAGGYHLNPDTAFTRDLVRGLLVNMERYGYFSCPCRLAADNRAEDTDIICPCDYRDPDLTDYGACYCALYVSGDVAAGMRKSDPVPERRPPRAQRKAASPQAVGGSLPLPVWRCRVCGYLCAREAPPEICPICRVPRERFERFM
ncbi:MAG: ferredoxin:glutaredoxin reductase [Methanomicrobiaceae archaeon]|uniref:ferredoxin:thioredoxin reductase n=1 Tax=hydrocarbon metagenome TaxID=938273 RepID=A0A0W8FEL6_9ZZZZ|nr:ferredoxin:glutaredoxin reductase [Methanomicrobiaceae archaeon]MDD5419440.1 ferredoxin-thioredoxin reductase catalytic domain-containing protein [Methanomicrobiaceae archaeon]